MRRLPARATPAASAPRFISLDGRVELARKIAGGAVQRPNLVMQLGRNSTRGRRRRTRAGPRGADGVDHRLAQNE
jgi:hypothetical protein